MATGFLTIVRLRMPPTIEFAGSRKQTSVSTNFWNFFSASDNLELTAQDGHVFHMGNPAAETMTSCVFIMPAEGEHRTTAEAMSASSSSPWSFHLHGFVEREERHPH
jgi:hypothetical protein